MAEELVLNEEKLIKVKIFNNFKVLRGLDERK